ncbi:hypothetical protein [Legionella brunensis]|uniref:Uncharacterized protein n=1 Tax=Legionella brunensis TaxID=29422 RepID=Q49J94_9GAMM|nr:hypothetical protein [Legionella brunensis]AAX56182.1 unknown [Legionella brunensis]KTC86362.1 hypothetical protein Lbru_0856 [Legionella brunensis]
MAAEENNKMTVVGLSRSRHSVFSTNVPNIPAPKKELTPDNLLAAVQGLVSAPMTKGVVNPLTQVTAIKSNPANDKANTVVAQCTNRIKTRISAVQKEIAGPATPPEVTTGKDDSHNYSPPNPFNT